VLREGAVGSIWSIDYYSISIDWEETCEVLVMDFDEASECLWSKVPDLSFIPSSLLANLIPEGLITSALGTSLSSMSFPEPEPLPLSFSGDVRFSTGDAAFCDTPMLSDKLSSPSRSSVYYKGVSEYSCIEALLNGDPFASFLDSDVFTFSICSFYSEIILA